MKLFVIKCVTGSDLKIMLPGLRDLCARVCVRNLARGPYMKTKKKT